MMSIGPKIWIAEQPMKVPLFGNIGARMTVIQLLKEELMVISPIRLEDSIREDLKRLGQVKFLVGPNSMHHLFLSKYREEYPKALLAGPLKLQKKLAELRFQITVDEQQQLPWADDIETVVIDSSGTMSEAIFLHKSSRTLIVTDLLFNLQKADSWIHAQTLRMNGVYRHLTMSRIGKLVWKDRALLQEKIKKISQWEFERIILAHGEIVTEKGKEKFLDSFQWLFS